MRIAILGAGAIGSAVGALLARTGQEVTLVARPVVTMQNGIQSDTIVAEFLRPDSLLSTTGKLRGAFAGIVAS